MKNKLITLSLTAIIAAGIFSACNSSENKGDTSQAYKDSLALSAGTAPDTVNTAKADWEKFKTDANDRIQKNEDTIQSLKTRIAKEDGKIKAKYNKIIAKLEERNNEMKAKLADYKDEGKDKFEKFRIDFDNSMDTLGIGIKDFFKGKKN